VALGPAAAKNVPAPSFVTAGAEKRWVAVRPIVAPFTPPVITALFGIPVPPKVATGRLPKVPAGVTAWA